MSKIDLGIVDRETFINNRKERSKQISSVWFTARSKIDKLDINKSEDREVFEREFLYPCLINVFSILNDLFKNCSLNMILIGSAALYLHGIYYDSFPRDIDIRIEDENDLFKYKILLSRIGHRYGFNIDFVSNKIDYKISSDKYEQFDINHNDHTISINLERTQYIIECLHMLVDYYTEQDNEQKVTKYKNKLEQLELKYPELFES